MIERIHLAVIKAIHETGTLAAASEQLCVTQSALSQRINKLEHLFSVELWAKSGRNIRLTEAGLYLLDVANRVLPQLDHVDSILTKFSSGVRGVLRIGMECHPCYRWLLQVIAPYLKAWPEVDVDIRKQFTFKGLVALFQYDIDILVTPDAVQRSGVIFYPVFDYEQVLVVSGDHEFANKAWVLPQDLQQQIILTYPIEQERLDIFRDFMSPHMITPKKHLFVEDTDILLQMVAANRGVTALPRWLIEESQYQFNVVAVSLGREGIYKKINIGVRDKDHHPHYFNEFLKQAGVIFDY